MSYSTAHWRRVSDETRQMVAEVPLYRNRPEPPADPATVDRWLSQIPAVGKRELRKGFPKALLRQDQDLHSAMQDEKVTLLATSGTTADRLQVIWEWSWWDPQEREAMRLNARIRNAMAHAEFREAVLTTPACGAGTCHFGSQTMAERSIDGMLFLNESDDPTHWTDADYDRMLREWVEFGPRGVEADPAYLALIARAALKRGQKLATPEFVTLTYETTTRAMRRDIALALDAPVYQLYGATEAGVLFMLYAVSAADGKELWSFDTSKTFDAVNKVPTHGGAIASSGAVVVDGMLFVGSGYAVSSGASGGNALLAFSAR